MKVIPSLVLLLLLAVGLQYAVSLGEIIKINSFSTRLQASSDEGARVIGVDDISKRDITAVNKGNFLGGDDIVPGKGSPKNGLINETTRWGRVVPVQFAQHLYPVAIAAILEAFEDLELKTCLSFVNRTDQKDFIEFQRLVGCFSYVGRQSGVQVLSIGSGCELMDTVEHEILHALGLFHEQSRSDRDDYVSIQFENILEGREHNFDSYDKTLIHPKRIPYDYYSLMHYTSTAFSTNGSPTIVTKNPVFQDVIGTTRALSEGDLAKVRRMYDCGDTARVSYFCDFEDPSICGYVPESGWKHQSATVSSSILPKTDATYDVADKGHMMIAQQTGGFYRTTKRMFSPLLEPTADAQCLEFSYYVSSNAISLSVAKETQNSDGSVSITELLVVDNNQVQMWTTALLTITSSTEYKLRFTVTLESNDVIAIDDVNVIDRPCETAHVHFRNYSQILSTTEIAEGYISPLLYTDDGYAFRISVYPVGRSSEYPGYMSVFFHLAQGVNDDRLQWPFANRFIKFSVVDQSSNSLHRMNSFRNLNTTADNPVWERPTSEIGVGWGYSYFMPVADVLNKNSYIKHDTLLFSIQVKDMNKWKELPKKTSVADDDRQCGSAGLLPKWPGSVLLHMIVCMLYI